MARHERASERVCPGRTVWFGCSQGTLLRLGVVPHPPPRVGNETGLPKEKELLLPRRSHGLGITSSSPQHEQPSSAPGYRAEQIRGVQIAVGATKGIVPFLPFPGLVVHRGPLPLLAAIIGNHDPRPHTSHFRKQPKLMPIAAHDILCSVLHMVCMHPVLAQCPAHFADPILREFVCPFARVVQGQAGHPGHHEDGLRARQDIHAFITRAAILICILHLLGCCAEHTVLPALSYTFHHGNTFRHSLNAGSSQAS